ncbi:MAG TPA: hypothetical protein VNK04_12770 [Gemmataceae bacterium]|nr:hypothetical protein [Gemmataceae bacterium]
MRATAICFGALALLAVGAGMTQANPYYFPVPRVAPDACGPGWYNSHPCGMIYGPNYWLTPAGLPFNGLLPAPPYGGGQASAAFPTHPYARSPRDYFMIYDNWYDLPYPRDFTYPRP